MDILLNEDFDVELDDRNDLATVTGRRKIEQSIRVMVTAYFYEKIGSTTAINAVEKLELQAERVAKNNRYIENLKKVTAERVTRDSEINDGIKLQIVYETGTAEFVVGE
jgi:hypothetical protein